MRHRSAFLESLPGFSKGRIHLNCSLFHCSRKENEQFDFAVVLLITSDHVLVCKTENSHWLMLTAAFLCLVSVTQFTQCLWSLFLYLLLFYLSKLLNFWQIVNSGHSCLLHELAETKHNKM